MKRIYFAFLLSLLIGSISSFDASAQDKDIQSVLDSKRFVFVAQSVTPLGGRFQQLTSIYDLSILEDSVISFLPYFGRAYSVPLDPSKGGIQFTSTDFDYRKEERKKGGWNITINPKDADDVRQMHLTVTKSGRATLQVVSTNRQSISFNGYVTRKN